MIGALDSSGTTFYLTDALGSILTSFTNASGSSQVKGEQDYAPYGPSRYTQGSLNTPKGYTGQYNDSLTGLDYYGARYYDPVVGVFLSADKVQGNVQGMNPYGYVGGNPETRNDPTGQYSGTMLPFSQTGGAIAFAVPGSDLVTTVINTNYIGSITTASGQNIPTQSNYVIDTFTRQQENQYGGYNPDTDPNNTPWAKFSREIGLDQLQHTFSDPKATWQDKGLAILHFLGTNVNNVIQLGLILGGPEDDGVAAAEEEGSGLVSKVAECGGLSFASTTVVATSQGEQAIGTVKVGEKVWAYNPTLHKMELEPVQHVWINHDNDLVDLTLTTTTPAGHGKPAMKTSETIHTNKKHPFLTEEQGFLPVGQITVGMHVLRADGRYGVVTGWKVVPGTKTMYNLEVAQDHTFAVGMQRWIVHNCGGTISVKNLDPLHSPETSGIRPELEKLTDQELLDSVNNPTNGDPIRINTQTGKVVDGNGRAYELLKRAALPGSSITPDTPIYYEPYTPSPIPDPWDWPDGG